MVGLIFGIIFLIAGLVVGFYLSSHKETVEAHYKTDKWGDYVRDENNNKIMVEESSTRPLKKYSGIAFGGGLFLALLLTFFGCITTIPTGHTGIQIVFGSVKEITLDAGFHMKAPWVSVVKMSNQEQTAEISTHGFSSDLQDVSVEYSFTYRINKANAYLIYQDAGKDYFSKYKVEDKAIQAIKTYVAKYTAEELISNRSKLAKEIEDEFIADIAEVNISITSTQLKDLDFTDTFTDAVEAKQVADQKSKQAKIEQEQAKMIAEYEKEIKQIEANAAAEVAKIQAEADMEVAKIGADSAEYQGKKDASIKLQALASINGWTVVTDSETGVNQLLKPDGTIVTDVELKAGVEKLIQYYYTESWNGILPETYVGDDSVSSILIGGTN